MNNNLVLLNVFPGISSSVFLGFCCKLYKIIVFYLQVNCNKSNYVAFLVFSGKAGLVAPRP